MSASKSKEERRFYIELAEQALELTNKDPQVRMPWVIFDRDKVKNFDNIISYGKNRGVGVGWSNPCFEIEMYAYFGEMPVIEKSVKCCEEFADKFEK